MEPLSLAVGLVALYDVTIDVLNRVHAYKDFGNEAQMALAQFEASKLKLQNWAKALGISDGKLVKPYDPRLDDPRTASVIQNVFRWSIKSFEKIESARASLKLPQRQRSAGTDGWLLPNDDIRDVPEPHQHFSTRSRIAWATGGKTKLDKDVRQFGELVNILEDVVPPHEPEAGSIVKCMGGSGTIVPPLIQY